MIPILNERWNHPVPGKSCLLIGWFQEFLALSLVENTAVWSARSLIGGTIQAKGKYIIPQFYQIYDLNRYCFVWLIFIWFISFCLLQIFAGYIYIQLVHLITNSISNYHFLYLEKLCLTNKRRKIVQFLWSKKCKTLNLSFETFISRSKKMWVVINTVSIKSHTFEHT